MISIIGAGRVGSAAAFDILRYRISDVTLIDTDENRAKGEALDMMQAAPAIEFDAVVRIDTPQEALYYANGGILQYVLRQLLATKPQTVGA